MTLHVCKIRLLLRFRQAQHLNVTLLQQRCFSTDNVLHRTHIVLVNGLNGFKSASCIKYVKYVSTSHTRNCEERKPPIESQDTNKLTKDLLENASVLSDDKCDDPEDNWCSPPFPGYATKASQEVQKGDPKQHSIVMFPGQGCQYVGMGKSLLKYSSVLEMYSRASKILDYDLLKVCTEGPRAKLNETQFCQAALLVTSLAALQVLREDIPQAIENCVATMGFSVGEIAALVFAGAITFEEGVHLVKIRGEVMQAASDLIPSGMMTAFLSPAARLPLALEASREWAAKSGVKNPVCAVANYLYPGCKVIAGNLEALEFLEINAKEFGIKNTRRIAVSGAFHTPLMDPAIEAWNLALSKVTFTQPLIRVYSNVTGEPHKLKAMPQMLRKHLVHPVKWEQVMHHVYERPQGNTFPKSYECGPGESLKAMLMRINLKAGKYTFNVKA